jgi:chromosome segregation ATPase
MRSPAPQPDKAADPFGPEDITAQVAEMAERLVYTEWTLDSIRAIIPDLEATLNSSPQEPSQPPSIDSLVSKLHELTGTFGVELERLRHHLDIARGANQRIDAESQARIDRLTERLKGKISEKERQCDQLASEIAKRDGAIRSLEERLASSEQGGSDAARLAQIREDTARASAAEASKFQQAVRGKEAEVTSLQDAVRHREGEVVNLQQTVRGKEAEIANLQQTVRAKETEVVTLQQTVRGKETEIGNLQQTVRGKDAELAKYQQQVQALQRELEGRSARVEQLTSDIEAKEGQIANLEEAAGQRHTALGFMSFAEMERYARSLRSALHVGLTVIALLVFYMVFARN